MSYFSASVAVDEQTPKNEATEALRASRLSVLQGGFWQEPIKRWKAPHFKLAIFLSSTFTDTTAERNVILDELAPHYRAICAQRDIQLIFLDMRWGIRPSATLTHNIWDRCAYGLDFCFRESSALSFISLQSAKYGFRPLPREIIRQALDTKVDEWGQTPPDSPLAAKHRLYLNLVKEWYTLSNTLDSTVYHLKTLTSKRNESYYWDEVHPTLLGALSGVEFAPNKFPMLKIGQSITEWEFRYAKSLASKNVGVRMRWIHRNFPDEATIADPNFYGGSETNDAMRRYKKEMTDSPMKSLRLDVRYDALISGNAQDYLQQFKAEMIAILTREIEVAIGRSDEWNRNGHGFGLPGDHLSEILHHYQLAHEKVSAFFGREALLDEIIDFLVTSNTWSCAPWFLSSKKGGKYATPNHLVYVPPALSGWSAVTRMAKKSALSAVSLAIVGHSGTGKTAVMAKLAQLLYARERDLYSMTERRPILLRFCGTSSQSLSGLDLVKSLVVQLHELAPWHKVFSSKTLVSLIHSEVYSYVVEAFQMILETLPVILMIDSIDQLSNDMYQARSKLSFLRNMNQMHPKSLVIVSTLPDERHGDKSTDWLYYYGCDSYLKRCKVPRIHMPRLDAEEMTLIVKSLVPSIGASSAWLLNDYCEDTEATALYASLLARHLMLDSTSKPSGRTVKELLQQVMLDLEERYGQKVVRRALALFTYSREGLSDSEMVDLLSLDNDILFDIYTFSEARSSSGGDVDFWRVPAHIWVLIRSGLNNLVVERGDGCIYWYHRQLREFSEDHFASEKRICHHHLGQYFGGLLPIAVITKRLIRRQFITFNTEVHSVWDVDSVYLINRRRCVESYFHLVSYICDDMTVSLNSIQRVLEYMMDFDLLCGIITCHDGYELVRQLVRLSKHVSSIMATLHVEHSDSDEVMITMETFLHFSKFILRNINTMNVTYASPKSARIALCNTIQAEPLESLARQRFYSKVRKQPHISSIVLGGMTRFDANIMTLNCYDTMVSDIQFSHNGLCLATCSVDGIVKLFEIETGREVHTLNEKSAQTDLKTSTSSLCWSFNDQLIANCKDSSINVWDAATGQQVGPIVFTRNGASFELCAAFSACSNFIAALGATKHDEVRVLSVVHRRDIMVCSGGHTGRVQCITFSPCGKYLATGSNDCSAVIWDICPKDNMIGLGSILVRLSRHTEAVSTIAWGCGESVNTILTGSNDGAAYLWDSIHGKCLATISPPDTPSGSSSLLSACFSPCGRFVAYARNHAAWSKASVGGTVDVYDIRDSRLLVRDLGATSRTTFALIKALSWSSQGSSGSHLLASGYTDGSVCLWDCDTLVDKCGSPVEDQSLDGHSAPVSSVTFYNSQPPDDFPCIIASASYDGTIRLWLPACVGIEPKSAFTLHWDPNSQDVVNSVKWAHNTHTIDSGSESHAILRLASGSRDTGVIIWEINVFDNIVSLRKSTRLPISHKSPVEDVDWSLDDRWVAAAAFNGNIILWDLDCAEGPLRFILAGHTNPITRVSFSSVDTNVCLSCSTDKTIRLWDVVSRKKLASAQISGTPTSFCFSPDGRQVAMGGSDDVIRMFNARDLQLLTTIRLESLSAIAWYPRSTLLICGLVSGKILVYDCAASRVRTVLQGHQSLVNTVACCDQYIVSGSHDCSVRLWHCESLSEQNFHTLNPGR